MKQPKPATTKQPEPVLKSVQPREQSNQAKKPELVLRFTLTERLFHWAMALPYLVLLFTGGLLVVDRMFEPAWLTRANVVDLHRWAGVALASLPFLVVLGGNTPNLLKNLPEAFVWGRNDLQWMTATHRKFIFPDTPIPDVGKFNPGQKVNFLLAFFGIPVFIASGAVMWFVQSVLLAWYIHLGLFFVVTPMVSVHFYMAVINPSTRHALRGMITGYVRADWAEHHHRCWFERQTVVRPTAEQPKRQPDTSVKPTPVPEPVLVPTTVDAPKV